MKKLLFFLLWSFITISCSKKDRLQVDTLQLYISPNPVIVESGKSIELSCIGKSAKSSNVDISPIWLVKPQELGIVQPTKGKKVIFTAYKSGNGKIKVVEGEVSTEVNLVVKSTQPSSGNGSRTLILYSDAGLNNQFGTPDIFTWSESGMNSSEVEDGNGAPTDNLKYTRFSSNDSAWFGGGIVLNKKDNKTQPVDLSSYSSKSLKFYIRLHRPLTGTENIKVEIEHTSPQTKATVNLSNQYGFNSNNTSWQLITIPLSSFSGVDYTKILLPFGITAYVSSPLTFDWDYVRWE